jgi:DNA-binding transcriptional regulator LsrR (DeoR family)
MKKDNDLLLEVANLYYHKGLSQIMISKRLNLSRPKVCRLLQQCRDKGIVETIIHDRYDRNYFLEQKLSEIFKLTTIKVKSNYFKTQKEIFPLNDVIGDYINSIIYENAIVAISRGKTIKDFTSKFKTDKKAHIDVIQLIGMNDNESNNISEMEIVQDFAKSYGGDYHYLLTPFFSEEEQPREYFSNKTVVKDTLSLARKANIALISCANALSNDEVVIWNNLLSDAEKNELQTKKAVGISCGYYYDIQGNIIETSIHDKLIGLSIEEIKGIDNVIGVVHGKQKAKAILGALRGNFFNTLITEEETALQILIENEYC